MKNMKIKVTILINVVFSTYLLCSCQSPVSFGDAVAIWHLSDVNDRTEENSALQIRGEVPIVELKGDEAAESRKRGGDGMAAHLTEGWLEAGQGFDEELNLTGKYVSILVRMKLDTIKGYTPILMKVGSDQSMAYKMAVYQAEGDNILEVLIGSDEIAGAHQLIYRLQEEELTTWHDVIFRFNGKKSELYVDGKLRDDEVTVGEIRNWNRNPVLIGAEYPAGEGYGDNTSIQPLAQLTGWIDHVVLWNRCLTDEEIACFSGVAQLEDGRPEYYTEIYRPQFHFSAKKHWLNDPNGLVYYNGTYHMFFQYMPPHRPGAYKDWGHAVSQDLVHWKQVDGHITPHKVWGGCWSGSAVVDEKNVAGFQVGKEKTIIAFITNGGNPGDGTGPLCTQCIAYSTDGGETFTYYDRNPVIRHIANSNRDPKVVWDAQSEQWVLSLYMDRNPEGGGWGSEYGIFTSRNLKDWQLASTFVLEGDAECPGFIPLPLDGNQEQIKWMFFGANGRYVVGTFDGKTFHPETKVQQGDYGRNFYAAMTWNNVPDGRCIHLAWMRTSRYPQMPYDQQMNFPTELTLHQTSEGIKAFRKPVREIASLYDNTAVWENRTIKNGENLLSDLDSDLYDLDFEFDMTQSSSFEIGVRGATIRYDAPSKRILCEGPTVHQPKENLGEAPLQPIEGKLQLRVLVDRTCLEVYGNDGEVVLTSSFMPKPDCREYFLLAESQVNILKANISKLNSIWQ